MREKFEYEGTATGEYKGGLYATYAGKEYPAVYLGVGRFILYSDTQNEHFTFPSSDGKFILQTDLRDSLLTRACEVRMIGMMKKCYETVTIRDILEEGVIISTYNPRLAFSLGLKPIKELGFTGLVDRTLLAGIYEERDYLWNPELGVYATFCQGANVKSDNTWFVEKDRFVQVCTLDHENPDEEQNHIA